MNEDATRLGRVQAYVALGDSFTEGPDCPPEGRWADRLAAALREANPAMAFANLAVEGAPSADVVSGQLKTAVAMAPDLASVICGANDVLLSVRPDIDGYAENFNLILDQLIEANPRVAIFTATIPAGWETLEMRPRTRRRVVENLEALNERTRQIAAERSLPLLDVALHPQLPDPENFAADGLHPSQLGHQRASVAFGEMVGKLLERRDRGELDQRSPTRRDHPATAVQVLTQGGGNLGQLETAPTDLPQASKFSPRAVATLDSCEADGKRGAARAETTSIHNTIEERSA